MAWDGMSVGVRRGVLIARGTVHVLLLACNVNASPFPITQCWRKTDDVSSIATERTCSENAKKKNKRFFDEEILHWVLQSKVRFPSEVNSEWRLCGHAATCR